MYSSEFLYTVFTMILLLPLKLGLSLCVCVCVFFPHLNLLPIIIMDNQEYTVLVTSMFHK